MNKRLLKFSILITLITFCGIFFTSASNKITLIEGSHIYNKIFLFFFPIGKRYDPFFTIYHGKFSAELEIAKNSLINVPDNGGSNAKLFQNNLIFTIRDIPIAHTQEIWLPVSIRCNKKITQKQVKFTIISHENIMVLKGTITDLRLGELTDDPYYKNRRKWFFPFYFDIRLQLNGEVLAQKKSFR